MAAQKTRTKVRYTLNGYDWRIGYIDSRDIHMIVGKDGKKHHIKDVREYQ